MSNGTSSILIVKNINSLASNSYLIISSKTLLNIKLAELEYTFSYGDLF